MLFHLTESPDYTIHRRSEQSDLLGQHIYNRRESVYSEGYYHSPGWNRDYSVIQIRTIEQLLAEQGFDFPQANITLAQAERVQEDADQKELF